MHSVHDFRYGHILLCYTQNTGCHRWHHTILYLLYLTNMSDWFHVWLQVSFNFCKSNPTGYYRLHLTNPTEREIALRLIEITNEQLPLVSSQPHTYIHTYMCIYITHVGTYLHTQGHALDISHEYMPFICENDEGIKKTYCCFKTIPSTLTICLSVCLSTCLSVSECLAVFCLYFWLFCKGSTQERKNMALV
jgi:hypothetical protein